MKIIPTTPEEVRQLAELYFTASHVKSKHKTVGNVSYVILYCLEHDINVTEGLQFIYLIGDKLAAQAELMLSMVYRSGKLKSFEEKIRGSFKDGSANAICSIHREGFEKKEFVFSIDDAIRAKLWNRNPIWKSYPQRMLTMKARTYALKDTCSDIIGGLIMEEEAKDILYHKNDSFYLKKETIQAKLEPKKELRVIEKQNPVVKIGFDEDTSEPTNEDTPAKLVKPEFKVHDSEILGEKYIITPDGKFHMRSGVILSSLEANKMRVMSPEEKKAYYGERSKDRILSETNKYVELFDSRED